MPCKLFFPTFSCFHYQDHEAVVLIPIQHRTNPLALNEIVSIYIKTISMLKRQVYQQSDVINTFFTNDGQFFDHCRAPAPAEEAPAAEAP